MLVYLFYSLGGLTFGLAFLGKRVSWLLLTSLVMAYAGYEVSLTMDAANSIHAEWSK